MGDAMTQKTGILSFAMGVSPALALALSPDILVLVGRIWSGGGLLGGFSLCLGASAFLAAILGSRPPGAVFSPPGRGLGLVRLVLKSAALVLLSAGALVSSGFAFNEIFVYWFPNFGFAFLLLALLFGLQFLDQGTIMRIQTVMCLVPAAGLVLLIFLGMVKSGPDLFLAVRESPPMDVGRLPGALILSFLVFTGIDLGQERTSVGPGRPLAGILVTAVFIILGLFLCWALTMLAHVSPDRLSQTFVPHLAAARQIWGDPGRMIMGGVIISGSMALVHALFTHVALEVSRLAPKKNLPLGLNRPKIVITLLALTIGLSLAAGLAGSEILETLILIILVLWFLSHVKEVVSLLRSDPGNNIQKRIRK